MINWMIVFFLSLHPIYHVIIGCCLAFAVVFAKPTRWFPLLVPVICLVPVFYCTIMAFQTASTFSIYFLLTSRFALSFLALLVGAISYIFAVIFSSNVFRLSRHWQLRLLSAAAFICVAAYTTQNIFYLFEDKSSDEYQSGG